MTDAGPAHRKHALHVEQSAAEQLADRHHVLVPDVPRHPVLADGKEKMHVRAGQAGRMRPGESDPSHARYFRQLDRPVRRRAQKQLTTR